MRTDTEGSPSVAEEKTSAVPHFRSGRRSLICFRLTNKGKVGVQRGRETVGVPAFLPPRRAPRRSRRPQTANPLAEVQRKTPRPLGANTLTQFACPGQPVLKKLPPVRGEHANAVRVPRSAGAGYQVKSAILLYFIIKCTRSCVKRNRPAKPDEFF